MCDWNSQWDGSPTTKQCEAPSTRTNLSGHHFCDIHWAEHEAGMALGFALRIRDDGDTYLVGHAQESIRRLREMLDLIEADMPPYEEPPTASSDEVSA